MTLKKFRSAADGAHIGVRAYPDVSERVPVIGSYSEVMIHFGLAGKPIQVSLVRNTYLNGQPVPEGEGRQYVAQVWKDGERFSAPIITRRVFIYVLSRDGDRGAENWDRLNRGGKVFCNLSCYRSYFS